MKMTLNYRLIRRSLVSFNEITGTVFMIWWTAKWSLQNLSFDWCFTAGWDGSGKTSGGL